jgi:hypothetical protein
MKDLRRRTVLQLSVLGGAGSLIWPRTMAAAVDPTEGRKLVFDEQFRMIDWTVWNAGRKASTFDAGFYGRSAFARSTGEEGFNPYAIVDDGDTENGKALQISAKHIGRQMSVPSYYGNDDAENQWISGNLQTARMDGTVMRGWRTGYFEARMRFPRHPLTWPAFWLMNGRSILYPATSVELDIVEHKGWEPMNYGTYLHEWGQPGEHHEGMGAQTAIDMTSQYCRYGMLVTETHCTPYFERLPVIDPATGRQADWPITRAAELKANDDVFWPLLTLALVPDMPYPDPLKAEDEMTSMRVDYVRVYSL